jgi:hypothetical protein
MLIIRQIKLGPFFEGGEVGTVTSPLWCIVFIASLFPVSVGMFLYYLNVASVIRAEELNADTMAPPFI